MAWSNGVTISYSGYAGFEQERSVFLTLMWFAVGIFGTALGTVILISLGEILENQETITRRCLDIESKLGTVQQKNKEADDVAYKGSWKCSKCGRLNASYIGTCGCGQVKQ